MWRISRSVIEHRLVSGYASSQTSNRVRHFSLSVKPACSNVTTVLPAPLSQSWQHDEKASSIWPSAWLFGAMIVSAISVHNEAHCAEEKRYSVSEVSKVLRTKLKPIRDKIRIQHDNNATTVPMIIVRSIQFPDRFGHEGETHVMDMSFAPQHCYDPTQLIQRWLEILQSDGITESTQISQTDRLQAQQSFIKESMQRFQDFYRNPDAMSLPLVAKSHASSMTISKFNSPEGPKVSISVFKDKGFTQRDVESIAKGYEEGFVKMDKAVKEKLDFQFNVKEHPGNLQESMKHMLEKFLSPVDPDSMGDGPGGIGGFVGGRNREGNVSSDPVEALKQQGVEVFDRESNQQFTWDYLAGYDHIKKEMEDTVINALKYPDVYDDIAKKTRINFESNRPKAILLEGPPGTGKTLTARILASQCDAPLVVLKMESIVSKWYGDSEKKLSKILDCCEQLPDAIIFVDEIDALTQSRDSENGIHEVSKRILSILLQRLEGFHGKSKSLLICTTNRKQDLDKALISRFDLIIPYDLPDHNTRMEIFRRYAKQFTASNISTAESPYQLLAKASEGLSCRDLKEACEQAERKCASRIVRARMQQRNSGSNASSPTSTGKWLQSIIPGGQQPQEHGKETVSDVPLLDDYMQALHLKALERKHAQSLTDHQPFSSV